MIKFSMLFDAYILKYIKVKTNEEFNKRIIYQNFKF